MDTNLPASAAASEDVWDIARIMHAIPHRYPMLMIDRVTSLVPDQSAVGIKNVSGNEGFFQGHFPNHPLIHGVLIIESMEPEAAGKLVYFMTIEGAKFRRPVVPGDQLRLHVAKERSRGNVWKFHATGLVDGISVAEATFSAMIMDRRSSQP